MFLPYLMFSAWLDFWAEALQNKSRPHVRDPLADKGAGDISSAALDALGHFRSPGTFQHSHDGVPHTPEKSIAAANGDTWNLIVDAGHVFVEHMRFLHS